MNLYYAIAAETDTTFWEDVWNYLYDVYLRVDGNYQNLGLEKMPLFSIRLLVLGIFAGIIIACVAMAYHKQILGGAVRRLIERGCLSPDKAMTARELGYLKNPLIKNALARSTSLRSVVKCVGEEEFYRQQTADMEAYEEKRKSEPKLPRYKKREYIVDTATDRFYIPEDKRIRAEIKFEKKGSGWLSTVISIVVMIVAFFVLLLVLPQILGFLDDLFGGL